MLTVIIPTHNPHGGRLARTIEGLRVQSLCVTEWELIIIDNASTNHVALDEINLSWHPAARLIREERLGLTPARLRGFAEAKGSVVIMVDDDNVLCERYLEEATRLFTENPMLGAAGGKSIPEFEQTPAKWVRRFDVSLALRDLGEEEIVSRFDKNGKSEYPRCAPIGAGMAIRIDLARLYSRLVEDDCGRQALDRSGKSLASGGDNDITLTVLEQGCEVGYFPQLSLTHLIPSARTEKDYLARLTEASSRTWVQVLDAHGLRPWPAIARWTLPLRKARAYLHSNAWKTPEDYIRWRGACGIFEGQSLLKEKSR